MIGGTVVGMLIFSTFIVVVVMFVQQRNNARSHRRAVIRQIREDLFRDNHADDYARPSHYHHHHHHHRHHHDRSTSTTAAGTDEVYDRGSHRAVRLNIPL